MSVCMSGCDLTKIQPRQKVISEKMYGMNVVPYSVKTQGQRRDSILVSKLAIPQSAFKVLARPGIDPGTYCLWD